MAKITWHNLSLARLGFLRRNSFALCFVCYPSFGKVVSIYIVNYLLLEIGDFQFFFLFTS